MPIIFKDLICYLSGISLHFAEMTNSSHNQNLFKDDQNTSPKKTTCKFNEKHIDYDTECVIMEICNPMIASSVVKSNRMIALALPCRVMMFSEVKGGPLKLTTMLPTKLIGMIDSDNEVADREAHKVEQIIKEIMDDCKEQ